MKKRISVVLAIVVSFSCFSSVLAAKKKVQQEAEPVVIEKTWDELNISAKTAFELGLIERDYSDNLALSQNVSRAEFVQMLHKILTGLAQTEFPESDSVYYSDVEKYHYAANEINYMTAIGMLSGYDDGTFRPEQPITCNEAIVMLLNVAGYNVVTKNKNYNIISFASGMDMLKYVSTYKNNPINREDAATLLGNFLFAQKAEFTSNDIIRKGNTVLKELFDAECYESVIEGANGVSLYSKTFGLNSFQINKRIYSTYGDKNYSDFVGLKARVFVNSADEVIAAIPYENKLLVIDAHDITDFRNNVYYYDQNNHTKQAKVDRNKDVMLNGLYSSDVSQMEPVCGYVKLIDNDTDSYYDVVKIESYETYVVDKVILDDSTIIMKNTDASGTQISRKLDNWLEYSIIGNNDAEMELYEISSGMVVSLAPSGEEKVLVYVSSDKVEGVVKRDYDDENTYIIDGTKHTMVSNAYMNDWSGIDGITITFLLDRFGNIAGVESFKIGEWKYAAILSCRENRTDNFLRLRMLDEDGEIKTFETDKKLKIDGEVYNDSESAKLKLYECYSNFEETKIGQELVESYDALKYDRMSTRLVRYYLSPEGKIKKIDTPIILSKYDQNRNTHLSTDDCLMITAKGRLHYTDTFSYMLRVPYDMYSEVEGEAVLGSKSKVFVLPKSTDDLDDETTMGVYNSLKSAGCVDNKYYASTAYGTACGDITDEVVVLAKDSGESSSYVDIGIYQKKKTAVNDDLEVKDYLCGIFGGENTDIEISAKNIFDISTLQKGDVVIYSLINGKIKIESLAFRVSDMTGILTEEPKYVTLSGDSHYFAKGRIILAQVKRIEDTVGVLKYYNDLHPNEIMPNLRKAYMYSKDSGNELTKVDVSSIKTYDVFGRTADYIIIYQREGEIKEQFIIRQ